MIRLYLEAKTRDFEVGRDSKLKIVRRRRWRRADRQNRGNMEKATKEKRLQEAAVVKTKDKYKSDCVNINGLTAQTALTQGKDLDKVRRFSRGGSIDLAGPVQARQARADGPDQPLRVQALRRRAQGDDEARASVSGID